jgi:hypothetical protein
MSRHPILTTGTHRALTAFYAAVRKLAWGGVESWTGPQVDSSDSTYEATRVDHGPCGGPVASGMRQPHRCHATLTIASIIGAAATASAVT